MKNLPALLLLIGNIACTIAQDCTSTLSGKILDYHDKTALDNAIISISGAAELEVRSASDGTYIVENLCNGDYKIEVSHPFCTTISKRVTVRGNTTLDMNLEHHLEKLEEVKVVGDIVFSQTNSAQEVALKTVDIERFSSASLGDALKELSGVSSLNTGATIVKPAIHGLNGSRVLILNDGVRMQDMEWGDEHAPNVDINAAGSVTLVKGASALRYGGDAIGGTILLEPIKFPAKDTLFGKTLINGVSNGRGGNIASELTKSFANGYFISGQGSYKRLGDHEAPDYILSNTGIEEIGASLRLGKKSLAWGITGKYAYYEAEIAILRASHIGNVDDLILAINGGEPRVIEPFTYTLENPRQRVRHHLGKLELYKRFEGLGKWTLQYDFQSNRRFEFDVRRGDRDNLASIDLELTTHTLTTDFKWDSEPSLELHAGAMGRYQDNFANPLTGVRRFIPDYEKYDFGAFIIGEYQLNDNWILDAGMRFDYSKVDALKFYRTSRWEERGYAADFSDLVIDDRGTQLLTNPVFDYSNLSATTGFSYEGDVSNIKFNYALSQRAPNPAELFSDGLHHSAARIELGDLRIQSETSHKLMLSFDQEYESWGFRIEPYFNRINGFILLEPTGTELTLRGAFPVWGYRQTDARLLGFDLSAHANWTKHWQTTHNFAMVKGKELDTDTPLINVPAANFANVLSFSKPNWNGLQLSLQQQYVFQQNEVPPNIFVFSPETQQDVLLEINSAPEAYQLFNFRSQMTFPLGKQLLTTSLTINNLFNNNYRDYLNRQRFFADDLGRNLIIQLKLNY